MQMPYSPIKFRSIVVKPYNYNPDIDDPKDIVYAEGPARPGRIEVRIPAAAAPLAAMIPAAAILSLPTPNLARVPALRPVLPSPVRVVSDIMINKD